MLGIGIFFFALLGCEQGKQEETAEDATDSVVEDEEGESNVQISWEGEPLHNNVLPLGTLRRFVAERSGLLTIQNTGARDLSFVMAAVPAWISTSETSAVLGSGELLEIALQVDNRLQAGELSDNLSLVFDQSYTVDIDLEVTIEPYVQYNLQDYPDVETTIRDLAQENNWIGGAVAVVQDQDIVFLEGFGYADMAEELRVDPYLHRFRWASVAKGMAGVVSTQLVRDGVLDLDASIATYYPSYVVPETYISGDDTQLPIPAEKQHISMRQLLSHTGCIQHYSNGLVNPEPSIFLTANPAINTGMEWALEYWLDAPLLCVPGEQYNYSTFGYNLAGVVLEKITQQSYEDVITDRISRIIEAQTIFPDRFWDPAPNRVQGYKKISDAAQAEVDQDVSWKLAGGGFNSTPEDFAKYCAGLMGEELITSQEKQNTLWNPPENAGEYGLGFNVFPNLITHSGSQQSALTALKIYRSSNTCIVVMLNSRWGSPWDMVNAVYENLP